jgi:hypothetical protein
MSPLREEVVTSLKAVREVIEREERVIDELPVPIGTRGVVVLIRYFDW